MDPPCILIDEKVGNQGYICSIKEEGGAVKYQFDFFNLIIEGKGNRGGMAEPARKSYNYWKKREKYFFLNIYPCVQGEVSASIHRQVIDKYGGYIHPHTVIALKVRQVIDK